MPSILLKTTLTLPDLVLKTILKGKQSNCHNLSRVIYIFSILSSENTLGKNVNKWIVMRGFVSGFITSERRHPK